MRIWGWMVVAVAAASCGAAGEASLTLNLNPKPYSVGTTARLRATALDGSGKVGAGVVRLSSSEGSLVDGADIELDSFGTATADFVCDQCSSAREVTFDARWAQPDGKFVRASIRVTPTDKTVPVDCTVGSVSSSATPQNLDLFGTPVYFNDGSPLEAGRYRVKNKGGCMKYNSAQRWMTQAWVDGSSAWWLIGDSTNDKLFILPGVFGWTTVNGKPVDHGAATFAECDRLNLATAPRDFDFAGGRMGIMLADTLYSDNTAGERNPTWELTRAIPGCP